MTGTSTTTTSTDKAGQENRDTAMAVKILLGVLVLLVLWGASIVLWGVPGLYIPALALVPVIYLVLVLLSRG